MKSLIEMRKWFEGQCMEEKLEIDCLMDGDITSQIAIIGEAPGPREAQTNMPLVGGTGQLLWQGLRKQGLTRNSVYVTYVVKRQLAIATNKRVINQNELDTWNLLLNRELCRLPNLKYIFIMGDYALKTFLNTKGISNWRGSVLPVQIESHRFVNGVVETITKDLTAVCTYNPAMVIRKPSLEPVLHMDIAKLIKVSKGEFKPYNIEPLINPTPEESIQWCEKMIDEKKPIAFDIEVISDETACVGFANSIYRGMCINFRDLQNNRWSCGDERRVRRSIQDVLHRSDSRLVAQNGSFDSYYLWFKDRIRVHKIWFDTMLAHHTLYPTLPHGLGFLTTQYTNHPYYKDEGKNWREGGNIDSFWVYNIKDCCITLAVSQVQAKELRDQKLDQFFFDHIMRLQPHLVRMTVGGVLIDVPKKDQLAQDLRLEVADLNLKFNNQVKAITKDPEREVNPNSPTQLSVLFFKDLRLPGKGTKTDDLNRQFMINHPGTPPDQVEMLKTLGTYKKEMKFLTTYAEMRLDNDHRIRCEYKQTGVQSAPGRLSSAGVLWGSGTNLQNQPERAYELFVADDGYGFGYFDLSQAEARVVAWLAKIEPWIEQFEKAREDGKYDAHRALASEMFGIPYDEVPTKDREADGTITIRYVAKRCRHGLNYRMQAKRLAESAGLSLRDAGNAFRIYHHKTPELAVWWQSVIDEVKETRELWSPFGRRLLFLGRLDESALDSVIAFKPQSTIGDKVSSVIYRSEDDPEWPSGARICLNIHDALISLSPLSQVKTCLKIMKKYAEEPMMINGMPLIIPAETKVSIADDRGVHRWSNLKEIDL